MSTASLLLCTSTWQQSAEMVAMTNRDRAISSGHALRPCGLCWHCMHAVTAVAET